MVIKKTKNAVRGVFAGFLSKIISILFPFLIRTVILIKLGEQYIGLSGLFNAVLNVLNLAELGFSTAIVFSMYKPIAEDDQTTIRALLNAYRKIFRIIAIIVLVAGLCVMPFLPYLISGSYPADINLYVLFSMYLANNVFGYLFFAYKSALLTAHQRGDIQSNVHSIINIFMYMTQIILLYIVPNYYVYAIIIPISTMISNLVIGFIAKKKYPQYFCEGKLNNELKSNIKKKISALVVHRVGSVVQGSIDTICISAFLGITMCGRYNNYMYICTAIQGFVSIIFQSIVAGLGNYIHKESVDNNYKLFKNIFFVNAIIVSFCSTCLFVLYQPFIKIWSIKTLHNSSMLLDFSVVASLVLLFYINNIRSACGTYKEALGLWDHDKIRPLCISLFNLVGTLISAYYGSLLGIILSTVGAYVFVSLYWETKILFKYYFKKSPKEYFKKFIIYFLVCMCISIVTYAVCKLIHNDWIIGFVLKVLLCCLVVPILLIACYCRTEEFKYCYTKVKNMSLLKKFKTFVKHHFVFKIQNDTIWKINKDYKQFKKIRKKIAPYVKIDEKVDNNVSAPKKIWFCWLQGLENAPDLVKACYQSLQKHLVGYEINVITSQNLGEYVELPDYIITKWKNKSISNAHFSDVIRIALLAKWGGTWIDSTVLCTGKMPSYIENSNFFVFSNEYRNDLSSKISNWFIHAIPNHPIIVKTRDLLYKYWKQNDKICHYFLFHMIMTIIIENNEELVNDMPFVSNINPHVLQFKYLFNSPNDSERELIKQFSAFHKLSYKFDKELTCKENTNYQLILKGDF